MCVRACVQVCDKEAADGECVCVRTCVCVCVCGVVPVYLGVCFVHLCINLLTFGRYEYPAAKLAPRVNEDKLRAIFRPRTCEWDIKTHKCNNAMGSQLI